MQAYRMASHRWDKLEIGDCCKNYSLCRCYAKYHQIGLIKLPGCHRLSRFSVWYLIDARFDFYVFYWTIFLNNDIKILISAQKNIISAFIQDSFIMTFRKSTFSHISPNLTIRFFSFFFHSVVYSFTFYRHLRMRPLLVYVPYFWRRAVSLPVPYRPKTI